VVDVLYSSYIGVYIDEREEEVVGDRGLHVHGDAAEGVGEEVEVAGEANGGVDFEKGCD